VEKKLLLLPLFTFGLVVEPIKELRVYHTGMTHVRTNKLKEFGELLLDNILLKMDNETLGNRNPKWNEWFKSSHKNRLWRIWSWRILMNKIINLSCMPIEQFFHISSTNPSFVFMEIGTSSRVLAIPYVLQLVTKPISPLRGEIIPLLVQTFIIPIPNTIIVSQPMEGSERFNKE